MERDLGEGGEDPGSDRARDLGDEPPVLLRDTPPDILAPIDADAPVSGHHVAPPGPAVSLADTPEHDWDHARDLIRPAFRPVGTHGLALDFIDPEVLAKEADKRGSQPVVDEGPAGLPVVYTFTAGSFDIVVNADHLLSWGIAPSALQDAALANLAAWSATAAWSDEESGQRRLISSDTGDGLRRRAHPAARGPGPPRPRTGAARADPHRPPGPAPHDGRVARAGRPGVRPAVRRIRRRTVGWRGRADRPPGLRAGRRPPRRIRRLRSSTRTGGSPATRGQSGYGYGIVTVATSVRATRRVAGLRAAQDVQAQVVRARIEGIELGARRTLVFRRPHVRRALEVARRRVRRRDDELGVREARRRAAIGRPAKLDR